MTSPCSNMTCYNRNYVKWRHRSLIHSFKCPIVGFGNVCSLGGTFINRWKKSSFPSSNACFGRSSSNWFTTVVTQTKACMQIYVMTSQEMSLRRPQNVGRNKCSSVYSSWWPLKLSKNCMNITTLYYVLCRMFRILPTIAQNRFILVNVNILSY